MMLIELEVSGLHLQDNTFPSSVHDVKLPHTIYKTSTSNTRQNTAKPGASARGSVPADMDGARETPDDQSPLDPVVASNISTVPDGTNVAAIADPGHAAEAQRLLNLLSHFPIEPDIRVSTYLTQGYMTALRHRMIFSDLLPGMRLDMRRYIPTFVYDVMMLPGSLSRVLHKSSEDDIMDRLTPAILPGFRAVLDPDTKEPILVSSNVHVTKGVVVFGQGRNQRALINAHYQDGSLARTRPLVCIEALVPTPRRIRETGEKWHLERTLIRVETWMHTAAAYSERENLEDWDFENFMSGSYHDHDEAA